ncbi:MAG: chemotaxis protein CheW [Thiomargarita sp.]|nr:chemotaxis protein CheW [Thiomargarita sp.]
MSFTQSPFQWLQNTEQCAKQRAKGLPHHEKIEQIWQGVAFKLGENHLVASLEQIREVLPYMGQLAKIPGSKPWIKGLANIRGLLLPVIDLGSCLADKAVVVKRDTRMLIINQAGILAGLLVDEVLGIKYFPEQLRNLDTSTKETWMAPFINGIFEINGIKWVVFDMGVLVKNDLFLNAAL